MMKDIIVAVKGFFMGAANVVPGVSGGTIALLTGIYSRIINAIDALMRISNWKLLLKGDLKAFWKAVEGRFLLALGIGVVASVFTLAKLMEYVLANHPVQTWAFFFGLILASVYYMLRDIKNLKWLDAVQVFAGLVLGLVVCTLTPTKTPDTMWFVFICGAIAVCTMILPGISGSFILVILGKYDYIMRAIGSLDFPTLIVFALGCVVGILAFAKFLHWLLARYERSTMLVLIGFVLGSLVKVWPWHDLSAIPDGQLHIASALIWCFIGLALIVAVELLSRKQGR